MILSRTAGIIIVPLEELRAARPYRQEGYMEECMKRADHYDAGTGMVTFKSAVHADIRQKFSLENKVKIVNPLGCC